MLRWRMRAPWPFSPNGTLFVGNRSGDKVYAVRDEDGDFKADKKWVVASGLNTPNGVALKMATCISLGSSRISEAGRNRGQTG